MSLPVSRNRTWTPSLPVISADVNDIQDRIIALHAGKHGDRYLHLPGIAARSSAPGGIDDSLTRTLAGLTATTGAVGADPVYGFLPIPLHRGDRIKSFAGFVYDTGGGAASDISIWRISMLTGITTQIGATTLAVAGPAFRKVEIGSLLEVVTEQRVYVMRWDPSVGADRFLGGEITYDHP